MSPNPTLNAFSWKAMKPTNVNEDTWPAAALRNKPSVFATRPCRGLISVSLVTAGAFFTEQTVNKP